MDQCGHGELRCRVESCGGVGVDLVAGDAVDEDELAVVGLVGDHALDAELGAVVHCGHVDVQEVPRVLEQKL